MTLLSFRPALLVKLALLLALAGVVTLMVAPHLTVGPPRVQPGDILQETLVIPEGITLEDERSTEQRRRQALADLAPIYDFDAKLKERTLSSITLGFAKVRSLQAAQSHAQGQSAARLRQNALERISVIAALNEAAGDLALTQRERAATSGRVADLSGRTLSLRKDQEELERSRFELKAVAARAGALESRQLQLKTRLTELEDEAHRARGGGSGRPEETVGQQQIKADFELALGIALEDGAFEALAETRFGEETERAVESLVAPVLDLKIVQSREVLGDGRNAIQIRSLESTLQTRFEALQTIVDVAQVRALLARSILAPGGGQAVQMPQPGTAYRAAVLQLAQRLVRPNLTENREETQRQQAELWHNTSPVYFNLKKGDVVARAGDVATAQQAEVIRALSAYRAKHPRYSQMAGTFLVVLVTFALMYQLMRQRIPAPELRLTRLALMGLLLLLTLGLSQVLLLVVPALTTFYAAIPPSAYTYLIPASLTSLLASVLLRFEVAVFLGFAVSVCVAVMMGNSLTVFIYAMLGSAVAAIPMRRFETRYALWQQGLRLSIINLLVVGTLHLLEQTPIGWPTLYDAGAALLNGWGVAFVAATLLPILERSFDITTNLRLLELSNMNQPALKELAVRAPGTYHHSIVVGNLSESAAEGIGINPLLVRVASYYHDLGKMLCPLYFVENQGQRNYHDDLPAKTSARIIINHVRDGLEIAKRYRLGRAIADIIAQHHGDSLVRYFFHKAQEELPGAAGSDEGEFRYPGPRPQSKEAGLVMVADVTEAAIRSLDDPSPDEIRQMVQKLSTRIYMEGQLDESGLTFNDLTYIEKTFTRMLLSIHHHRISYPEFQVPPEHTVPDYPPAAEHPNASQRMSEAAPQAVPDDSPTSSSQVAHDSRPDAGGDAPVRARRDRMAGD